MSVPRHQVRIPLVAAGVALLAVLASCGSAERSAPSPVTRTGVLAEPGGGNEAVTYDPTAAPPGARLSVLAVETGDRTTVLLVASGLNPNRTYGSHAHVNACGVTGEAAGSHFQHEVDPVQPSVDPAFANPDNEIWLDFTTDATGAGSASTTVPFGFDDRAPASVVLHEKGTATGEGEAGKAGSRLACLTVAFGG